MDIIKSVAMRDRERRRPVIGLSKKEKLNYKKLLSDLNRVTREKEKLDKLCDTNFKKLSKIQARARRLDDKWDKIPINVKQDHVLRNSLRRLVYGWS